jgi:membrane protein DedA with SNARE-associated domain
MEHLIAQLGRHGLGLIFGNVLVERLGAPLPAWPVIFLAGAIARRGGVSPLALLAVALGTALAMDLAWFLAGRWQGLRVLRAICRLSLAPAACVRQTEALFARRRVLSLLFAKFIPGYTLLVLPLAGASRMAVGSFVLWDGLGCLIWAGSAALAGYVFHRAVGRILGWLAALGTWALVLLGAGLLLAMAVKWWERQRFYKLLRLARIGVEELRRLLASGDAPAIVDVRTRPSYQLRHIPGALRMSFSEIEERLARLPLDREVVLYCT